MTPRNARGQFTASPGPRARGKDGKFVKPSMNPALFDDFDGGEAESKGALYAALALIAVLLLAWQVIS